MQWFDWMVLAIVLVVAVVETIRGLKSGGMGLPLFDAAGLVASAVAATHLSGRIAQMLHWEKHVVMILIFVVLGICSFLVGYWLFTMTSWSFQSLDGFFSFLFGVAGGWAIAHMVLRILIESQGVTGPIASAMGNAVIAREIFEFRGWNWVMRLLFRVKLGPEVNPDVG